MKEVEKDRKEEEDVKIVSGVSVSVTPSWTLLYWENWFSIDSRLVENRSLTQTCSSGENFGLLRWCLCSKQELRRRKVELSDVWRAELSARTNFYSHFWTFGWTLGRTFKVLNLQFDQEIDGFRCVIYSILMRPFILCLCRWNLYRSVTEDPSWPQTVWLW